MIEADRSPTGVTVELNAEATMRDGVALRANVYRPAGQGPWPTLLARTPYSKDRLLRAWCGIDPVQAARRGFMVVVQDTRGRFASEGVWDPLRYEREDGYDTVEWAARLPGSNGRVGMFDGSYCGNTQWMAAIARPPALRAISPFLTWSDPLDGFFARGGAVELGIVLYWSLLNGLDQLTRADDGGAESARRIGAAIDELDRLNEVGYWELPVAELRPLARHGVRDLGSIRALDDPNVARWSTVAGSHDRVEVPTFHTGGWYDMFLQGTLDNYAAMAAAGREARLLVGPWTHESFGDAIGARLYGLRASRNLVPVHAGRDWKDLQLAWMRRQLEPDPNVELPAAPVRIFVMGRNAWRDESSWPLERARVERWFLGAGGTLRPGPPRADDAPTCFRYDPADPVPTLGGQIGALSLAFPAGPLDQAPIEARADVCVFTSAPLEAELEVTGRVRVVLHAESSAPSTDWVARLCDVHPDGRSFNVCDGIVRLADGADGVRRVEIDLWSTSNVFLAGHRLRVHVTSSSFPRWDRNLNTGNQRVPRFEVARQCVHHDAERPSWIELPVVA